MAGMDPRLSSLKSKLAPNPPHWFNPQFLSLRKVDTVSNELRKRVDWRYFQVYARGMRVQENLDVTNQIQKITDLYEAKETNEKKYKNALDKLCDIIGSKDDPIANIGDPLREPLFDWKAKGWKDVTDLNHVELLNKITNELLDHFEPFWYRFKKSFVEPMTAVNERFEELPEEVLESDELLRAVFTHTDEGRDLYPRQDVTKVVEQLLAKYHRQCEEQEKKAKKKKETGGFFKTCARFLPKGKKRVKKTAHREALNMYDQYFNIFEDDANDEYFYHAYDDGQDIDIGTGTQQSQALLPFYLHNPAQVQPVVIAGYDAGHTNMYMSTETSMAFAMFFGVAILLLTLCLFLVVFGVAAVFGVYAAKKQNSKLNHGAVHISELESSDV